MPTFIDPLPGAPVTGRFGDDRSHGPHEGIDLSAAEGTPIRASNSGYVDHNTGSGFASAGYAVTVSSGLYSTWYCHLRASNPYATADGVWVRQGDVIGYVGQTGNADGPHLHFQVRVGGVLIDPLTVIRTTSEGGTGGTDVVDTPQLDESEAAALVAGFEAKSCQERQAWLNARQITTPVSSALFTATGLGINPWTEQELVSRMEAALASCDLIARNPADVVGDVVGGILSVPEFLAKLMSAQTWIRVGYVVGGAAVGLLGLYWTGKALGMPTPKVVASVGKRAPKPIPVTVME